MYKTFFVKSNIHHKSLAYKIYYVDGYNYICGVEFGNNYMESEWSSKGIYENFKNKEWIRTNHKTPEIIINRGGRGERI